MKDIAAIVFLATAVALGIIWGMLFVRTRGTRSRQGNEPRQPKFFKELNEEMKDSGRYLKDEKEELKDRIRALEAKIKEFGCL